MKKEYKAINIKWETDGENVELPDEVTIPDGICSCSCQESPSFDENCESINNYLSDKYGWLVISYSLLINK